MKKNRVREVVFSEEEYDTSDWPPIDAVGFLKWFDSKMASIPEEWRPSTTIHLASESGYKDSHYVSITIEYWRIETDPEAADRISFEKATRQVQADDTRKRELQTLAALKAKYPDA